MSNPFEEALTNLRGSKATAKALNRKVVRRAAGLPDPIARRAKSVRERSEADLCDLLGAWIAARGFEVFYEVPLNGGRPDVVGLRTAADAGLAAGSRDQTLAIEAKLRDVNGVIKQGWRIVHAVDLPYVALPLGAAEEVIRTFDRMEVKRTDDGRRPPALPGVLAVGRSVRELRRPTGAPKRRLSPDKLRDIAERFGAERGGVPNTDQTERNLAIWQRRAGGESIRGLAAAFSMSATAVRHALRRLGYWRTHLADCNGNPCLSIDLADRDFYAGAHRRSAEIRALVDLP